jgi:hypothetical protein
MGGCTSKSAMPVSAEAARRRSLRKSSSKEQLQKQLDVYHSQPRHLSPNVEKRRPSPIMITNPNAFDDKKVSLVGSPVLVLDSTSSSMNNSSTHLNLSITD